MHTETILVTEESVYQAFLGNVFGKTALKGVNLLLRYSEFTPSELDCEEERESHGIYSFFPYFLA